MYLRTRVNPFTFIVFLGLALFRPLGIPSSLGMPDALVNLARHLLSKWMETSERRDIKTMEDEMKRVRSNAEGIGAGSLRTSSKHVQFELVSEDRLPRRANNCRPSAPVVGYYHSRLPDLYYLSSKNPSIELICISVLLSGAHAWRLTP